MIAFVQANAPFFTWTGAVFYASVAVGLVLWAVSGLWRLMVRLYWRGWQRRLTPWNGNHLSERALRERRIVRIED